MKRVYIATTTALLIIFASILPAEAADFAVIVNRSNSNSVDKAMIKKVYMGEMTSWPDGGAIAAVDLSEDSTVRESFSGSVLGKSVSNIKALWAQKVFSGKGVPPRTLESDDEVKKFVSGNKNAIGYIKSSNVDDSVKVVK